MELHLVGSHGLWGHFLWNGAHWMADYIDAHGGEFAGRAVVELGAGAALPTVMAHRAGAALALATDYPDEELVANVRRNVDAFRDGAAAGRIAAAGYLWGGPTDGLLAANGGQPFDVVIMCDVIFNHSEHRKLLAACDRLLAPRGVAWCVFSHYRPHCKERDLALLRMASAGLARPEGCTDGDDRPAFAFVVERVAVHRFDHVFFHDATIPPEDLTTVYAYRLTRAP